MKDFFEHFLNNSLKITSLYFNVNFLSCAYESYMPYTKFWQYFQFYCFCCRLTFLSHFATSAKVCYVKHAICQNTGFLWPVYSGIRVRENRYSGIFYVVCINNKIAWSRSVHCRGIGPCETPMIVKRSESVKSSEKNYIIDVWQRHKYTSGF